MVRPNPDGDCWSIPGRLLREPGTELDNRRNGIASNAGTRGQCQKRLVWVGTLGVSDAEERQAKSSVTLISARSRHEPLLASIRDAHKKSVLPFEMGSTQGFIFGLLIGVARRDCLSIAHRLRKPIRVRYR